MLDHVGSKGQRRAASWVLQRRGDAHQSEFGSPGSPGSPGRDHGEGPSNGLNMVHNLPRMVVNYSGMISQDEYVWIYDYMILYTEYVYIYIYMNL